jgi:lantibiotic modifying enzyme
MNSNILQKAIENSAKNDEFFHWEGDGRLGQLLFFGHLAKCIRDQKFDVYAHELLVAQLQQPNFLSNTSLSLSSGLSGLALAIENLSCNGLRYQSLLHSMDAAIVKGSLGLLATVNARTDHCALYEYDAVSGLSGIGGYLLTRPDGGHNRSHLEKILGCLISLSQLKNGVPHFKTPHKLLDKWFAADNRFPQGMLNLGLSHGIAGPLMTLSLAKLQGFSTEGIDEAIKTLSEILIRTAQSDEWGLNWPAAVPLDQDESLALNGVLPSRTAWCYGSPGVATALLTAGNALDDIRYKAFAITAMKDVISRPIINRLIDAPSFCHGVAGLLQIMLRFYNSTGDVQFAAEAIRLFDQIVEHYNPEHLLGFQNHHEDNGGFDDPRLFEGAAGIALVLTSAIYNVVPSFDRIFLVA